MLLSCTLKLLPSLLLWRFDEIRTTPLLLNNPKLILSLSLSSLRPTVLRRRATHRGLQARVTVMIDGRNLNKSQRPKVLEFRRSRRINDRSLKSH